MEDLLIGIPSIAILVATGLSFKKFVNRDEFGLLRDSGQQLNLNFINLIPAIFRKNSDPLRSAHLKAARWGCFHVVAMFTGWGLVVLFAVAFYKYREIWLS